MLYNNCSDVIGIRFETQCRTNVRWADDERLALFHYHRTFKVKAFHSIGQATANGRTANCLRCQADTGCRRDVKRRSHAGQSPKSAMYSVVSPCGRLCIYRRTYLQMYSLRCIGIQWRSSLMKSETWSNLERPDTARAAVLINNCRRRNSHAGTLADSARA